MTLAIIVALTRNLVIGQDGDIPWHLPADLKRFRQLTTGHSIIMGRRTWESIGEPLPRRRSIVVTRNPDYEAAGAECVGDIPSALALVSEEPMAFVIGGAQLYIATLPLAQKLYRTEIDVELPGDTYFPRIDRADWRLVAEKSYRPDRKHAYAFSFRDYERR